MKNFGRDFKSDNWELRVAIFQSDVNIDLLIILQIVVSSWVGSMEPPEEDWYVDCSDDEKYSYPGAEKGMKIEHNHFYFLLKIAKRIVWYPFRL